MRNGEFYKYGPDTFLIEQKQPRWFWSTKKFIKFRGDNLTLVPVNKPKKLNLLHKIWCYVAPEFWRRYKRHRSHLRILNNWGVTDKHIRANFGSQDHIANEKVRVLRLPPTELNDFDSRRRLRAERSQGLNKQLRDAFEQHRITP